MEETGQATIYADDNSAGEEATTVGELKSKTEKMLDKIFINMRAGRLLVNAGKTKVMLFATRQKRAKNDLAFNLNIEGKIIKEEENAGLHDPVKVS